MKITFDIYKSVGYVAGDCSIACHFDVRRSPMDPVPEKIRNFGLFF